MQQREALSEEKKELAWKCRNLEQEKADFESTVKRLENQKAVSVKDNIVLLEEKTNLEERLKATEMAYKEVKKALAGNQSEETKRLCERLEKYEETALQVSFQRNIFHYQKNVGNVSVK